jgi:hypothetical protein
VSFCVTYAGNDITKDVLKINPAAAKIVDRNGDLPLHLTLRVGKKWHHAGVKDLFEAFPGALLCSDHQGLSPVMIASSVNECDLTTIFELLRNNPTF